MKLTPAMRSLLTDLHLGSDVRRRGMHSKVRDENHWLGHKSRAYISQHRSTADGLVRRGLARWVETDHPLATHRLIPTALPAAASSPRRT